MYERMGLQKEWAELPDKYEVQFRISSHNACCDDSTKPSVAKGIIKETGDDVIIKYLPLDMAYDEEVPLADRDYRVAQVVRELKILSHLSD